MQSLMGRADPRSSLKGSAHCLYWTRDQARVHASKLWSLILLAFSGASPIGQLLLRLMTLEPLKDYFLFSNLLILLSKISINFLFNSTISNKLLIASRICLLLKLKFSGRLFILFLLYSWACSNLSYDILVPDLPCYGCCSITPFIKIKISI